MFRILLVSLLISSSLIAQNVICIVDHPPIDEQSAIVKSQTYEDVYWVCNDSDDDPVLFPLTSKGEIIIPDFMQKRYKNKKKDKKNKVYPGIKILESVLHDWEALAILGDTIVIVDVGNNGNARRDLGIYLVPEPNPRAIYQTRPLVWYPVRYEDQKQYPAKEWEYDCEAIFTYQGKIYFLTKHRTDNHISRPAPATKLYRMDTRYTDRTNVLKQISRKEDLGGWVTDANMAEDESGMVLLAQNPLASVLWYFPKPKKGDNFLSQPAKTFNLMKADQAEGICFKDSKTIIVSNEQREWFEVSLSEFSKK